jgi:hypothetical protein
MRAFNAISTWPRDPMKCNRVMFVVEYEDGRTAEFSIDQWTLSLGDYAARIIARERQEKGDLPPGEIRGVRCSSLPVAHS